MHGRRLGGGVHCTGHAGGSGWVRLRPPTGGPGRQVSRSEGSNTELADQRSICYSHVRAGSCRGRGHNNTVASCNGTRHAELEAIDMMLDAGRSPALISECTLYVTVEPCIMCASALRQLQVRHVFFGCRNDKFGGCGESTRNAARSLRGAFGSPTPPFRSQAPSCQSTVMIWESSRRCQRRVLIARAVPRRGQRGGSPLPPRLRRGQAGCERRRPWRCSGSFMHRRINTPRSRKNAQRSS